MRPPELAGDSTPMLPVLQHATAAMHADGFAADVIVLLQPTSPLRRGDHIDRAVELLASTGADSVVTVVEVPHQYTPASVMRLDGQRLVPFLPGPQPVRRQDKPSLFARNGPAVLAVRRSVLDGGSLYGDDVRPLLMSDEESVDVDRGADLDYLEYLIPRLPR